MSIINYKQPKAEYVQFQRLVFGLLILSSVLYQDITLVNAYLIISIISMFTTTTYSPTTLIFKFISLLYGKSLFVTPPQYAGSYIVNRLASVFEDLMRISGGIAIIYTYQFSPISAWLIAAFMAIAMLISSFFGFCLSALLYIAYNAVKSRLGNK